MKKHLTIISTQVRQQDGLYSLNDLHKAAGSEEKHKPSRFIRTGHAKALIAEIDQRPDMVFGVKTVRGGNAPGIYACKELVYAYAMWISARFNLQVIRAFDQQTQAQPPALPAPAAGMSKELRHAINRKAHALSLQGYDRIREHLTAWVEEWRPGRDEAQTMDLLEHYDGPAGTMVFINAETLACITKTVAILSDTTDYAMKQIVAMEKETGRYWYNRA